MEKNQRTEKKRSEKKELPLHIPKMNLLLVDDDPVFCKIMEHVGKELDIAVTSCQSMPELDALALPEVFDAAVVDYYLDGLRKNLTGPAIARILKGKPVIFVSRNNECQTEGEVWPFSVKRYVSKETGPKEILEAALKYKGWSH